MRIYILLKSIHFSCVSLVTKPTGMFFPDFTSIVTQSLLEQFLNVMSALVYVVKVSFPRATLITASCCDGTRGRRQNRDKKRFVYSSDNSPELCGALLLRPTVTGYAMAFKGGTLWRSKPNRRTLQRPK